MPAIPHRDTNITTQLEALILTRLHKCKQTVHQLKQTITQNAYHTWKRFLTNSVALQSI